MLLKCSLSGSIPIERYAIRLYINLLISIRALDSSTCTTFALSYHSVNVAEGFVVRLYQGVVLKVPWTLGRRPRAGCTSRRRTHKDIYFKAYALTFTASPAFAILVAISKLPETAIVTPQNASRFLHPERRIAPAIGLPISKPSEMGRKSMPLRVP